jgi:hypothetical protein
MTYGYSWSRCDSTGGACVTVSGATGQSYVLGAGDVGKRIRVAVTASTSTGSTSATSAATAVVGTTTTPPTASPAPPPGGGGNIVLVDRAFVCNSAVNLSLVKVTMRNAIADAVVLATGCSGRIGRVEVDTWSSDGIKVQNNSSNAAHDLVIESGYVECHAIAPGVHQDGIQAMGGRNLTFRNLTIDCLGNGNLYVNRAGSGATTPTDVVCESCLFGGHAGTPLYVLDSIRSGARNSLVCTSPRWGRSAWIAGTDSVNAGNTILPASDPRCV